MLLKNYKCLLKNSKEAIDNVNGVNRLDAARMFACKKQIPLKEWLKIYTVSK
jgi:hypothetical protein